MSNDLTTPAPTVWPCVSARNAKALIEFLTTALGFEVNALYNEGEVVHHAELCWPPGGGIMLGSVREGDTDGRVAAPGTLTVYAVHHDPDALCARARAAGATIVREPFGTDYGSRDFALRDPEGNYYQFGTYPGAARGAGTGGG
jgi:uncharacterized glyoxalase superfamily protein PhnB